MKSHLAVAVLEDALRKRGEPKGVIVHSDRGSQFRSRKFRAALKAFGATGSMGRVGACGDNAAMESFFALVQKNVPGRKPWVTRRELSTSITHWIERTYQSLSSFLCKWLVFFFLIFGGIGLGSGARVRRGLFASPGFLVLG
ncbi:DDE-type integrase/transposase/recombinase [Trueperella pecoris]|uniref:DDE-type integrase/transposase/recombinase n=1 Tax=Trueperella pecoris TaxID=2733571 RepID=A0A7M1QYD8_9ACTO|nr:DDE-type integrase/transposase/recombinase [Trueperella pecoris]